MNLIVKTCLICTALALGACSSTEGKPDSVASTSTVSNPDDVTCRNVAKTGTRISSKVCKTNRAWAEIARRAREDVDATTRTATQGTTYQTGGAN